MGQTFYKHAIFSVNFETTTQTMKKIKKAGNTIPFAPLHNNVRLPSHIEGKPRDIEFVVRMATNASATITTKQKTSYNVLPMFYTRMISH